MKLPHSYYLNNDVLFLAKDLLGKVIYTCIGGKLTAGIIVETEAYNGILDKASHAYGGRRTSRTEMMYSKGGVAYVYLCYGIHNLFNVVTSHDGEPHAILIRAVEPYIGKEVMEARRCMPSIKPAITAGPGSLAKALGIDRSFNGTDLTAEEIWIEEHGTRYTHSQITQSPRIGVAYAEEHALLPWRYFITGNRYVSKPNNGI